MIIAYVQSVVCLLLLVLTICSYTDIIRSKYVFEVNRDDAVAFFVTYLILFVTLTITTGCLWYGY